MRSNRYRTDIDRLRSRVETLGAVGRNSEGGLDRVAFTPADMLGRQKLIEMFNEAGLAVRTDPAGNIIGRREGTEPGAPAVLLGSHIDTVPNGGMFDGALGVLTGLECIEALNTHGIATRHPVEVIAFTDEEGVRFRRGLIGSRAFVGESLEAFRSATDHEGAPFDTVLRNAGLDPERLREARRDRESIRCFIELHPEQGRTLETAGIPIGIVDGIVGIGRMEVTFDGTSNHAGTTAMEHRQDALLCAAELALTVEAIAKANGIVGTTGVLTIEPGASNVIPGKAVMSLEFRTTDAAKLEAALAEAAADAGRIAARRGAKARCVPLVRTEPVLLDPEIGRLLREAAGAVTQKHLLMSSGAGHDAMMLARIVPTGMIFVPSRGGISHNPAEWTEWEHVVCGAEVLFEAVLRLAEPVQTQAASAIP